MSDAREAAAGVVHGVYRLAKACVFHVDATNDAVTSLTAAAAQSVRELCAVASCERVVVTFLGDAVFVNGQILRASRDTHALAQALGEMLGTCGVSELTLAKGVRDDALVAFGTLMADCHRDRSNAPRLLANRIPGISAGKASIGGSGAQRDESPSARAARTYATAVVTVQRVFADLRGGKLELPRRIKRVAQRIVAHADDDARLLVALAASAGATVDPAALAVSSAIFAVAMTRQLTTDRAMLANAASAALLYDAGRLAASGGEGPMRELNDDELDRVPSRSVVMLTAIGRLHAPARARTALVYEVWSQRRAHRVGPVYRGRRPPTLLARILGFARAFAELRAAGKDAALTVDDAIQVLANRAADGTERAIVKLLVGALGIYPAGTLVELSTGELAVVMATPPMPVDYVRPPVKILYDARANLLDEPIDVDLANVAGPVRFIRKGIDADEQQAKAMRSYVIAATAAKRRAAIEPPPEPRVLRGASLQMQAQRQPPRGASREMRAPVDPRSEDAPPPSSRRSPQVAVPPPPSSRGTPARTPGSLRDPRLDESPHARATHVATPASLKGPPSSGRDARAGDAPRDIPHVAVRASALAGSAAGRRPPSDRKADGPPPASTQKKAPPPHLADPSQRAARRPLPRNDSVPPVTREERVFVAPKPAATPDLSISFDAVIAEAEAEAPLMGGPDAPTVRPPPGVDDAPRRPVDTVRREEKSHDDLLAAFLADAPIESKPPPKD